MEINSDNGLSDNEKKESIDNYINESKNNSKNDARIKSKKTSNNKQLVKSNKKSNIDLNNELNIDDIKNVSVVPENESINISNKTLDVNDLNDLNKKSKMKTDTNDKKKELKKQIKNQANIDSNNESKKESTKYSNLKPKFKINIDDLIDAKNEKKTKPLTIHLDLAIYEELENVSNLKKVSKNYIVNTILSYVLSE